MIGRYKNITFTEEQVIGRELGYLWNDSDKPFLVHDGTLCIAVCIQDTPEEALDVAIDNGLLDHLKLPSLEDDEEDDTDDDSDEEEGVWREGLKVYEVYGDRYDVSRIRIVELPTPELRFVPLWNEMQE